MRATVRCFGISIKENVYYLTTYRFLNVLIILLVIFSFSQIKYLHHIWNYGISNCTYFQGQR